MQYRDRREEVEREYMRSQGRDPDEPVRTWGGKWGLPPTVLPQHFDMWGSWRYDADMLGLELDDKEADHYFQIDLRQCTTAAEILNWIMQVAGATWCDSQTVGDLVQAFDDLLNPEENICPEGQTRIEAGEPVKFDVETLLRRG